MRSFQFWTLILLSSAVSLLMIKEILLSRAIIREQHVLVDSHEEADRDKPFTDAWQKLALMAYRASADDPGMIEFLKKESITVHQGPPPPDMRPGASLSLPGPAPTPEPSASGAPSTPAAAH